MAVNCRAPGGSDRNTGDNTSGKNQRSHANFEGKPSGQFQPRNDNNDSKFKGARGRSATIKDYASCEFDGQLSDE